MTPATTPSAVPPATDPRALLAHALDQLGALVVTTDPAVGGAPTPCEEYDVARLVGHVLAVVGRIAAVAAGRPFDSVPRECDSTDWAADWAAGRAAADAALASAEVARLVQVPWGTVSLAAAIGSYVGEAAVHSWDLAVATGGTDRLDPALAEVAYPAYVEKVPATPRGGPIPFGPVVDVGADATPYARLVAWTGRDPRWRP